KYSKAVINSSSVNVAPSCSTASINHSVPVTLSAMAPNVVDCATHGSLLPNDMGVMSNSLNASIASINSVHVVGNSISFSSKSSLLSDKKEVADIATGAEYNSSSYSKISKASSHNPSSHSGFSSKIGVIG